MGQHYFYLLLIESDYLAYLYKQLSHLSTSDIFFCYIFKLVVNVGF